MRFWFWDKRDRITRIWPEKLLTAFVWRLPTKVIYWAVVRAACKAEPRYSPADVTAEQMLKALR